MPVVVGDLTVDPTAQSFISLADAEAYLAAEDLGTDATSPMALWFAAGATAQEASLVRASRWLAEAYIWRSLDGVALARVGRVAARLAAETFGRPMFGGTDANGIVQRERLEGVVDITYRDGMTADAAGLILPWLRVSLRGLISVPCTGIGIWSIG